MRSLQHSFHSWRQRVTSRELPAKTGAKRGFEMKNQFNAFAILVASCLSLPSAFAGDLKAGTYVGRVFSGDGRNLECEVTVEENSPLSKEITVNSPRLPTPLVWETFSNSGEDYQRNDRINGFIRLERDSSGGLSAVMIQYQLAPTPENPFNLSTWSEFCGQLSRSL